jgi:hypothetical protein
MAEVSTSPWRLAVNATAPPPTATTVYDNQLDCWGMFVAGYAAPLHTGNHIAPEENVINPAVV